MYTKQALVIGNDAYMKAPLRSCVNDATDVSMTLNAMGFQVQPVVNMPLDSMQAVTRRFIQSIQPGSIVIFYFSGHGLQYNGINYLLGTDDEKLYLDQIDSTALNVQKVIDGMHARRPRLVLAILDACRGYEVNTKLDASRLYSRAVMGIRDGLAPMQAPPATIIVHACAENEFSSTLSMNDRNSLYTFHLLRHICTANTDIDLVLRNVAADVQRDPINVLRQVPFRYSSLNESICLIDYGGMNAQMSPMGWPGVSGFQPYQNQYVKAHHGGYPQLYIDSSQNQHFMPQNYRAGKKKFLPNLNGSAMNYGYPYQWPLYRHW